MTGYYSLGFAGYEVSVEEDGEHVRYRYVGPTGPCPIEHVSKVRYNAKCEAFFLVNGRRIYLHDCLWTNI